MSSVALAWTLSRLDRWRVPLFLPLVLPWSVLAIGDRPTIELVFLWGVVDLPSLHWFTLSEYLFRYTTTLPSRLLAWPIAALFYLGGVTSTLSGDVLGREDRRVTAGLLAISGLNALPFTLGTASRNPGTVFALPLGTVVLGVSAAWAYWSLVVKRGMERRER